jgi:hypothetical protein
MAEDSSFDFSGYEPSFIEDGYGITGPQQDVTQEDLQDWDLNAWSDQSQANEDFTGAGGGCLSDAGDPPGSGTFVLGSIDGTCQWIDTTTCS